MAEVKLHGNWASPSSYRVIWALELKGIPYEYVEEDLANKSPFLLNHNPVHKKIPVLVHGGKRICEPSIILEYIDETWPQKPLLPSDPLDRATARFWIKFIEDKEATLRRIFLARGEEREKARRESLGVVRRIEDWGIGGKKFFGGEEINMVDLAMGWIAVWMKVLEEVVDMKLVEGHEFPRLRAWSLTDQRSDSRSRSDGAAFPAPARGIAPICNKIVVSDLICLSLSLSCINFPSLNFLISSYLAINLD